MVANQVVGLATGLVVARLLDPATKGPLDLVTGLGSFLMPLANLGLSKAIVYTEGRGRFTLEQGVNTSVMAGMASGLAIVLVAGLALPALFATSLVGVEMRWVWLVLLSIPFFLLSSFWTTAHLVTGRIGRVNLVLVLPQLLFTSIFLGSWWIGSNFDADAALRCGAWAKTLSIALPALLTGWLASRYLKLRPRIHRPFLREGLVIGRHPWGVDTVNILGSRLTLYLVGFLPVLLVAEDRSTAVGLYSMAVTMAEFVWRLPEAVELLLFPWISQAEKEDARRFTPMVCRWVLLTVLLGSAAIALLAGPLLTWINPAYLDCLKALWILLPGTIVWAMAKILHADLMGRGRMDLVLKNTGFGLVVAVVIAVALIPGASPGDVVGTIQRGALANGTAFLLAGMNAVRLYMKVSQNSLDVVLRPRLADIARFLSPTKHS